ncbi:hypothetical protein JA116_11520 [Morganella morganii]|uniref:hypothetical protein n=1 Tax=Morganella morganii TaxID=582 RepID=UPI001C43D3D2|nr:hypothetical protein [Morganella morganii]QXO79098.1 hypothetical protein JA116_11520 [Morganella morganii]
MTNILNMHDLSIIGVAYNKTKNELTFNIDDDLIIIFCDVFHWDLTSFEMQNIIFEISIYKKILTYLLMSMDCKKGCQMILIYTMLIQAQG